MTAPATILKVEVEAEVCSVCGGGGDLLTPEEHDAAAAPLHVPLRTMLLHLNHNKVVPEGRVCSSCAVRAADAYEFSAALAARAAPPLSDKIRALRRRLHELTQKIDVFIVVGGPGGGAGAPYSEDDIIMVEKDALAAAAAADAADLDHARDARGDSVYQCSVCPLSFQRVSELRAHAALHPGDALHSCWTCGAQFPGRAQLREHSAQHAAPAALVCHLCDGTFSCQAEMRRHEAACEARCPACGAVLSSRGELAAHCAALHGRERPPCVCPACFRSFPQPDLLSAHLLRHRQAKQFVCGYADCVLRFGTRSNLMAHIRKCHAAELPEPEPEPPAEVTCDECGRTFGSSAALKRHSRTHQRSAPAHYEDVKETGDMETEMEVAEGVQYVVAEGDEAEGEVEYLEVETLDADFVLAEEVDDKSDILALQ